MNPQVAAYGAGPVGKQCRTCKHVHGQVATVGACVHVCTKADAVIDLAFAACGEFVVVLTDAIGEIASDEARQRARAKREAKIAAHPELFC
jgi:hypothetical protein